MAEAPLRTRFQHGAKDGYKDVFVHHSAIQMDGHPTPGQLVEFDVGPAMGGVEARNVHAI
jgi:cold shock CspA family protein